MQKKDEHFQGENTSDANKIWCDEKEGFQYIKACESNCKKKNKCKAFKNYLEPGLF
jgi:hypothetical protein